MDTLGDVSILRIHCDPNQSFNTVRPHSRRRANDGSGGEVLEVLPQVLDDQCESFIYPLAAVDFSYSQYGGVMTTPGDFLKSIEADMIQIAGLLAFVDSEGTDDEICAAVEMIYALEGKHWRDLLSGRALGSGQEKTDN